MRIGTSSKKIMLGIRGHAELSYLEERLKIVLGPELMSLASELLTEIAVVGSLTSEASETILKEYNFENPQGKRSAERNYRYTGT